MSTAFLTDKYEVTMLQAAMQSGAAHRRATFELFARKLPPGRAYGMVSGVDRAIAAVKEFVFTEEHLSYLSSDPLITDETIEYLRNYRFRGSIWGYREGELYFPYSPILTVEGTFGDAVLLETLLLSILNHDSAVGSAASRMVLASEGRFPLIEMGSRRAHEEAAVAAARAAYVAGFASTSNLETGLRYGVPTKGTAAHAFTLAHPTERDAFRAQMESLGTDTTLLVDTYNIEVGVRTAVEVAQEMGVRGPGAIRIDSGDLHAEPATARRLLDDLGATGTKILVSSDIDEYSIAELVERATPVDGVGAGTRVVTGSGHPTAGMVFKLVEIEDEDGSMRPVAKASTSKKSVGGRKFAFRVYREGLIEDEYYTITEIDTEDEHLQVLYLEKGEVASQFSLDDARRLHAARLKSLPATSRTMNATGALVEVGLR